MLEAAKHSTVYLIQTCQVWILALSSSHWENLGSFFIYRVYKSTFSQKVVMKIKGMYICKPPRRMPSHCYRSSRCCRNVSEISKSSATLNQKFPLDFVCSHVPGWGVYLINKVPTLAFRSGGNKISHISIRNMFYQDYLYLNEDSVIICIQRISGWQTWLWLESEGVLCLLLSYQEIGCKSTFLDEKQHMRFIH